MSTEIEQLKPYTRYGHIDLGRECDKMVNEAVTMFPGMVLPRYWKYVSKERFIQRYGEGIVWATTGSYHSMFFKGTMVMRIWTSSRTANVWMDTELEVPECSTPIPEGDLKKCRPLTRRVLISSQDMMKTTLNFLKTQYGI